MLKLFGLVCIVLVGASFGLKASLKLSARYKRLVDFYIFLGEICDCMRVGYDIEGIFAKESAEKLFTLNGYKITPKTSNLQKKDTEILEEYLSNLGMTDLEAGINRTEVYRALLQKQIEQAEGEMKEKSRLYSLLGIFAGIFVAIILI